MNRSNERDSRPSDELVAENLVAAERRAATLAELSQILVEGRDPLELAQRAVDLVMRATGAAGSYVFLWDSSIQRLVLRVASTGSQAAEGGGVRLRLGEGITGWAALMRRTAVSQEDITNDPRSVTFPHLDEEQFRSMVSVPIVANGSELMGVFNFVSVHSHAFDDHDINLATEVGGLLACGLVQARTIEDLRRQSAAAQFLLALPSDTHTSLQRCVNVLAQAIRVQLGATLCTIELADRDSVGVSVRPGIAFSDDVDKSLVVVARSVRDRRELADVVSRLDGVTDRVSASFGPMMSVGTVTCYRSLVFSDTDRRILEALSAQSAALISSLSNPVSTPPLTGRLRAIPTLDLAERALIDMGWRPGPTHPIICRVPASQFRSGAAFDHVVDSLRRLQDSFDGVVLVPSAPTVSMLVRHQMQQWPAFLIALRATIKELPVASHQPLAAGIGPLAADPLSIQTSLQHAESALQWAELTGDSVISFDDVEYLQSAPQAIFTIGSPLREVLQLLQEVARYDMQKGTELTHTLDTYLTSGCSMSDTAQRLYIHRNTLRHRLSRIEELMGRPVESVVDRTALALAARITAVRNSAQHGSPSPDPEA